MSAADLERPEFWWPVHWPRHDAPHDYLSCSRCLREAEHIEEHLACDCLHWPWDRVDVGTPATPELVWCCGSCYRIEGPAYDGPTP